MLRGTRFEKQNQNKFSPISDNGCDVYMLNSAIEYNDCVKWSSARFGSVPDTSSIGQANE